MIKQDQVIFKALRNVLTNCISQERREDYLKKIDKAKDVAKTSEIVALIASKFWSVYPEAVEEREDVLEYLQKRDALLRWFCVLTRTMKYCSSMLRCESMNCQPNYIYKEIIEHHMIGRNGGKYHV